MKQPEELVKLMLSKDAFSNWMNLVVIDLGLGHCTLECPVTDQMLNGFQIAHGGIAYALSDSALAFSSNSRGFKCVSIETSISHLLPVYEGDLLKAVCNEIHRGKTFAIYSVNVFNQKDEQISNFKGTVNISHEKW